MFNGILENGAVEADKTKPHDDRGSGNAGTAPKEFRDLYTSGRVQANAFETPFETANPDGCGLPPSPALVKERQN